MSPRRIGGIVMIAIGALVAFSAYQMSETVGNQIESAFRGSPTDSVMLRYVIGAVCAGVGGFLAK